MNPHQQSVDWLVTTLLRGDFAHGQRQHDLRMVIMGDFASGMTEPWEDEEDIVLRTQA